MTKQGNVLGDFFAEKSAFALRARIIVTLFFKSIRQMEKYSSEKNVPFFGKMLTNHHLCDIIVWCKTIFKKTKGGSAGNGISKRALPG